MAPSKAGPVMPFWNLVGSLMRTGIEGIALFANRFLYAFFNTAWAATYYFAYWRKWPFFALIIFGFLIDVIRFDRHLCGRIWSFLFSKRWPLVAAFTIIGLSYLIIVLEFNAMGFAFGAAQLHYEYAKAHVPPLRAQLVLAIETAGVSIAFVALIIYSIRQSAGASLIQRRSVETRSRFQVLLTLLFLLMLMGWTLSARGIDLGQPWTTTKPAYDPGRKVLDLIIYSAIPFIFAAGAKYWLFIVDAMFSDKRKNVQNQS